MSEPTVNELVNQALFKWAAVTKTDPGATSFTFTIGGSDDWSTWELNRILEDLNKSRDLDPTGLTTFMLLKGLVEQYLKDVNFDTQTLLDHPEVVAERVMPLKELRAILASPQVVALIDDFKTVLRNAALHYGKDPEDPEFKKILKDPFNLATLRRDALRSIDTLEAHQFMQGLPDPAHTKVNETIYAFFDINKLLGAMRTQEWPGVTLAMIQDPASPEATFFCFAIRNGATLTVLTDRVNIAHPDQWTMSRNRGRMTSHREEKSWFPHFLLKGEYDRKGNFHADREQLAPLKDAVPLLHLGKLPAPYFIWTVLLLDRIQDRFWRQQLMLPELSYTGAMVRAPTSLLDAGSALVKAEDYKLLEMPPLRTEDVTGETTGPQWEEGYRADRVRFNAWMEERYAKQVPEEFLNIVGEKEQKLLAHKVIPQLGSGNDARLVPLAPRDLHEKWEIERNGGVQSPLRGLALNNFGTKDKLGKDRLWAARKSQCEVIDALATKEYVDTVADLLKWVGDRVKANQEFLLNAAAQGKLMLPVVERGNERAFSPKMVKKQKNCLYQYVGKRAYRNFGYVSLTKSQLFLGKVNPYSSDIRCIENGAVASIFTRITPNCPAALAILFGVKEEELPWQFKNWFVEEPYSGNCILSRVDPEDWVLNNPWTPNPANTIVFGRGRRDGFRCDIYIAQSKTAMAARRKRCRLPPKVYKDLPSAEQDYHYR